LKSRPTEKGTRFLNQKLDEIDSEENLLKKKLWEIEDRVNEIKTEDLNAEIITNYLSNFVNTYDSLELGEKKILLESFVKKAEIKKSKEIKLTLQIPLEKFRVFIPDISAKSMNNRKSLMLHLRYNLTIYYKNLTRTALFYSPYSKKKYVI